MKPRQYDGGREEMNPHNAPFDSFFNGQYTVWRKNDELRVIEFMNETGEVTGTEPYTPDENVAADARLLAAQEEASRQTIEDALSNALVTIQAILDDTNSNINQNPAARIKELGRAQRRAIRLLIRRFDGIN